MTDEGFYSVSENMVLLRSLPPPAEGVRHQQAETAAVLDGKGLGSGTLFVAES